MEGEASGVVSGGVAPSLSAMAGRYLSFELGGEHYGVDILKIQEIMGVMPTTRVPGSSRFIRGVINLRGAVIPVIDLRVKFGMPVAVASERSSIVVAHMRQGTTSLTMGVMVDAVSEVTEISAAQLGNLPEFGGSTDSSFIFGVGKLVGKTLLLLDIDKILASELDFSLVRDAAKSQV